MRHGANPLVPKSCGECHARTADPEDLWGKADEPDHELTKRKLCKPCFWGSFATDALRIRAFWPLVCEGTSQINENKQETVFWKIDWDAVRVFWEAEHPLIAQADLSPCHFFEMLSEYRSLKNLPESYWSLAEDDDGE